MKILFYIVFHRKKKSFLAIISHYYDLLVTSGWYKVYKRKS